jgi:L-lactate dehydrogenase
MKIGIVGTGLVGSTIAYSILMRKAATSIVMIDVNKQRASAEAADISHAVPFTQPTAISSGDYADLAGAGIVVIAAGVNQKPGESRLELLGRNAAIMRAIVPQILNYAPEAMILVTTNPVDVMTHFTATFAAEMGYSNHRIIGSGTTLDTARFRSLLGSYLGVDATHVHGYVIGEHGDSEVITWSIVDIGGLPLDDFVRIRKLNFDQGVMDDIDKKVRYAAYEIIEGKGATYYGIGAAVAQIVDVIAHDQKSILTICRPTHEIREAGYTTVSLPHLVAGRNVIAPLQMKLSQKENKALADSGKIIREMIGKIE